MGCLTLWIVTACLCICSVGARSPRDYLSKSQTYAVASTDSPLDLGQDEDRASQVARRGGATARDTRHEGRAKHANAQDPADRVQPSGLYATARIQAAIRGRDRRDCLAVRELGFSRSIRPALANSTRLMLENIQNQNALAATSRGGVTMWRLWTRG